MLNRQKSGLEFFAFAMTCIIAALAGSPAAVAQTGSAFSGMSSSENAKKPIDIESDKLEVDDKTQLAVFTGSVSATQGEYNLKSARLEVTYDHSKAEDDEDDDKPTAKPVKASQTATASTAADPVTNGQVKTIKAIGNVVVTSLKDDQKATGNEGFFQVKEQKITMTGDVVMTQKGNIVKCAKLNIDLNTSKSLCIPTEASDGKGGKKPGRVIAVLKRDAAGASGAGSESSNGKKKQKAEKPAEETKVKPKAAPGWQTQSE